MLICHIPYLLSILSLTKRSSKLLGILVTFRDMDGNCQNKLYNVLRSSKLRVSGTELKLDRLKTRIWQYQQPSTLPLKGFKEICFNRDWLREVNITTRNNEQKQCRVGEGAAASALKQQTGTGHRDLQHIWDVWWCFPTGSCELTYCRPIKKWLLCLLQVRGWVLGG